MAGLEILLITACVLVIWCGQTAQALAAVGPDSTRRLLSRSAALRQIALSTLATMVPSLSIPSKAIGMYENAPIRSEQTGPVKLA